jgi:hypothetical protein
MEETAARDVLAARMTSAEYCTYGRSRDGRDEQEHRDKTILQAPGLVFHDDPLAGDYLGPPLAEVDVTIDYGWDWLSGADPFALHALGYDLRISQAPADTPTGPLPTSEGFRAVLLCTSAKTDARDGVPAGRFRAVLQHPPQPFVPRKTLGDDPWEPVDAPEEFWDRPDLGDQDVEVDVAVGPDRTAPELVVGARYLVECAPIA